MAVVGTNGSDILQSQGSDFIRGLGGADTLTSIYDDTLIGGAGNDLLQANSPFSIYNGYASYEEASGPVHVSLTLSDPQDVGADQGVDTLVNLAGLIGSAYNDTLSAGPGHASSNSMPSFVAEIYGGGGSDMLIGGIGNDRLNGEAGDDTIDASTAGQFSLADGGSGNDIIFTNPNSSFGAFGGDGDDKIYDAKTARGGDGADTITAGHLQGWIIGGELYGEAGNDSLVGTAWIDTFFGGAGQNTIDGGGGGDFIYIFALGDAGLAAIGSRPQYQNTIVHETGVGNALSLEYGPAGARAIVDLGAGTAHVDLVAGGAAQRIADVVFDHLQVFRGSNGDDSVQGSVGDDILLGLDGANTLFGGDGNDSIAGGSGHNQVNGNKGDDTIVGQSNIGDWLLGGQGNDSISFSGSGASIVNGNMGNDTLVANSFGFTGATMRGGQGDDIVGGSGGGDLIFGDLGANTLTGYHGADTFCSGAGHDVVSDFNGAEGDHVLVAAGVGWEARQSGADVLVTLSNGGDLLLQRVQLNSLAAGWIGAG